MKKTILLGCFALLLFSFAWTPPKKAIYSFKKFEKKLGLISPGLYASKYEVTNYEYQEFLQHLKHNPDASLYEQYRIFNENWNMKDSFLQPFENNYHIHPAYFEYPVVNISQEGAKAYCEWLTATYNAYPKRAFEKVKFRLPTEQEWITAAQGGRDQAIFPWGGYYVRNGKGKYLANFRRVDQTRCKKMTEEGMIEVLKEAPVRGIASEFRLTTPSNSFLPNDFGIYNFSGNVAEMLAEPGRTKGGSWDSYGYYIRIDAEDEYAGFTEPSPMIGFRYFMEVIEE